METISTSDASPKRKPPSLLQGYRGDTTDELPIGGYAALMGAFGVLFAGTLVGLRRRRALDSSHLARDVVLLGVATHKLTRIVTHDWVTIPLRAPFTHYEESAGGGEVKETSRGRGLRRAVGDLVTCPFCSGPWIATALLAGARVFPKETRFLATMLGIVTASDFLHHVYARAKKLSG
jgi:hypothetical protein